MSTYTPVLPNIPLSKLGLFLCSDKDTGETKNNSLNFADSELTGGTMHGEKRGKGGRSYHNEELGSDAMGGYSLEDYIYSLESRGDRVSNNNIHSDPDVYGQLQQKERDLILAAELGKALLEKNEDLSKQNEKIAEDFSQKLEVR